MILCKGLDEPDFEIVADFVDVLDCKGVRVENDDTLGARVRYPVYVCKDVRVDVFDDAAVIVGTIPSKFLS